MARTGTVVFPVLSDAEHGEKIVSDESEGLSTATSIVFFEYFLTIE